MARAAGVDGNAVFNGVVTGLAITLVVMVAVLIVLVASRMGKSQSAAPAPVEMAMTPASAAAATAAATRDGSEQPDLIHQELLPTNPQNQSYLQNARRDCSQQRNASVAYLPTLAPPDKSVSTFKSRNLFLKVIMTHSISASVAQSASAFGC